MEFMEPQNMFLSSLFFQFLNVSIIPVQFNELEVFYV